MDQNEFEEACNKFCDYLQANGLRPIALVIHVCDDHTNQEHLLARGLSEVVDEACLKVLCHNRGLRVEYL